VYLFEEDIDSLRVRTEAKTQQQNIKFHQLAKRDANGNL
jgi:hypothetical protein